MPHSIDIQSLVDSHERPFMVIDKSYRIIALNQPFEKTYGVSTDRVLGRPCYEVSHGNNRPCDELGEECPYQQVYRNRQTHSCLHIHKDEHGQQHRVRVTVYPLTGANGEVYLGESIQELSAEETMSEAGVSMVGASPEFLQTMEQLVLAAQTDSTVLLQGETGTGKELAASFLHHNSERLNGPFLTLDCTVLTENLFEAEVFGHEHGAFTGSHGRKTGLFELANGGTLFLDEIGELSPFMQAKLLRVLESGEYRRVGGTRTLYADVRIVCATNRDLRNEVKAGGFREDLYYRIACLMINLPSLRDRSADIPILAETLLDRISRNRNKPLNMSKDAMAWLQQQHFPGNIRELRNVLCAAAAVSSNGDIGIDQLRQILHPHDLPTQTSVSQIKPNMPTTASVSASAEKVLALSELEEQQIRQLLQQHNGKRTEMADALGISVRTLYRKLKKYGLS